MNKEKENKNYGYLQENRIRRQTHRSHRYPYGLSESAGIRNSIKQPVMARDLSRAGTEVYVAPFYKLTYDEDGYCVKMTACAIPEDIAEKLAELNK